MLSINHQKLLKRLRKLLIPHINVQEYKHKVDVHRHLRENNCEKQKEKAVYKCSHCHKQFIYKCRLQHHIKVRDKHDYLLRNTCQSIFKRPFFRTCFSEDDNAFIPTFVISSAPFCDTNFGCTSSTVSTDNSVDVTDSPLGVDVISTFHESFHVVLLIIMICFISSSFIG